MTPKKTLNDLRDELAEQYVSELGLYGKNRSRANCDFKFGFDACLSHLEPVLREVSEKFGVVITLAEDGICLNLDSDLGKDCKQAADRLREVIGENNEKDS